MAKKNVVLKYVRKNSLLLYNIAISRTASRKNIKLAIHQERLDILQTYVEKAPEKYQRPPRFKKIDCIDTILEYTIDKYDHLREIRNVVYFEKMAEEIVANREYNRALQLFYFEKLLLLLELDVKEKCWEYLINQKEKNYQKIIQQIDDYYIKKITC